MNDQKTPMVITPVELMPVGPTALESIERAQVDMQISTAKRYPRDIDVVLARVRSDATKTEAIAESCFYSLPPRRSKDGSLSAPIEGPSVRLAEVFLTRWQNLRAAVQFIGDDGKFVTCRGIVNDLENNVVFAEECVKPVTNRDGRRYSDDMVAKTIAACRAIAKRNAIFNIIPRAFVDEIYEEARRVSMGDAKTLVARRATAIESFGKMGISPEKIFTALGVKGLEGIDLEKLATLTGYRNSVKEGTATLDDIFNPVKVEQPVPTAKGEDLTQPPKTKSEPAKAADKPRDAAQERADASFNLDK